jgi:hypothetical protein
MPLFLKSDILKELDEVRGGHVDYAEARLLGEPIRQANLDPAEHEGYEAWSSSAQPPRIQVVQKLSNSMVS